MERLPAKKCSVSDLMSGSFVAEGAAPVYVKASRGDIGRANLIATVIDKGAGSVLLDDGTGRIEARSFTDTALFEDVLVGDVVLLVGRPREYQGQRYLVAEIARRLASAKWLELRRAELQRSTGEISIEKRETARETAKKPELRKPDVRKGLEEERKEERGATTTDSLLSIIKRLDDGKGAPIEQVIKNAGRSDAETLLTSLMAEGEIFEVRPGRVKVLE